MLENRLKLLEDINNELNGVTSTNPENNNTIVHSVYDLPKRKRGWIRLHLPITNKQVANNIINTGIVYNVLKVYKSMENLSDILMERPYFLDEVFVNFWKEFHIFTFDSLGYKNVPMGSCRLQLIIDMPREEYLYYQSNNFEEYSTGILPAKHIIGVIPNYGNRDLFLSDDEIEKLRESNKRSKKYVNIEVDYETVRSRMREFMKKKCEDIEKLIADLDNKDNNNNMVCEPPPLYPNLAH